MNAKANNFILLIFIIYKIKTLESLKLYTNDKNRETAVTILS